MKTFFTLSVLLFGLFYSDSDSQSPLSNEDQINIKHHFLKEHGFRILIEPQEQIEDIQICDLEIGHTYQISLSQEKSCSPTLLFSNSKKQSDNFHLEFKAEKTCETISLINNSCHNPFYISVSCSACQSTIVESSSMSVESLPDEELIEDIFMNGDCYAVSNVTGIGTPQSRGKFEGGTFGLEKGIIISTGHINDAIGPNNSGSTGMHIGGPGNDPDLALHSGPHPTFDQSGIEFDFVPNVDYFDFNFVFASEEYCEWVGSQFNDIFGIFISGPGINGIYSNNATNLAVIPGTTNNPITINSINTGANANYFTPNDASCGAMVNPNFQFDGYTTVFSIPVTLIPGETYHMKIIISDLGDGIYDSVLFLGEGSFNGEPMATAFSNLSGTNIIYEKCPEGGFLFERTGDINQQLFVNYFIDSASTATQGVDYAFLPTTIIIPPGANSFFLPVNVYSDAHIEDPESIIIRLDSPCSTIDNQDTLWIHEAAELEVDLPHTTDICEGQTIILQPTISSGIPLPMIYNYEWNTGETDPLIVVGPDSNTPYGVTVTDFCGTTAQAWTNVIVHQLINQPEIEGPEFLWFGQFAYYSSPNIHPDIEKYDWFTSFGGFLFGNDTTNYVLLDLGDSTNTTLELSIQTDICSTGTPSFLQIERDTPTFDVTIEGTKTVCPQAQETYWIDTEDTTVTDIDWIVLGKELVDTLSLDSLDVSWPDHGLGAICANITSSDYGNYQICDIVEIDSSYSPPPGFVDEIICDGEFIVVGSDTITTEGDYTISIDTDQGCDSMVHVSLTRLDTEVSIEPPSLLACGGTVTLDATQSTMIPDSGATLSLLWTGPGIIGANDDYLLQVEDPGTYCFNLRHELSGYLCETTQCVDVVEDNILPNQPSFVGPGLVCEGETNEYTITNNGGLAAIGVNWTSQNGEPIAITSPNTVEVIWSSSSTSQLCLTAENACGSSPVFCLDIQIETIPNAPQIAGTDEVCKGATVPYQVSNPEIGALYDWEVPAGALFTQNGNDITVDFSDAVSGEVCVVANNQCGVSSQTCFPVTVIPPPQSPEIVGTNLSCQNLSETFSIQNPILNGQYDWTVSGNATISGSGDQVDIHFPSPGDYDICATVEETCGISQPYCLQIQVLEALSIQNIALNCELNNAEFIATFEISGGDPSSYQVQGLDGTLSGNVFTSTVQNIGQGFSLSISDASICEDFVFDQAPFACDCFTDAGTFDDTPMEVCGSQPAEATFLNDEFLDTNDALLFIISSDENDPVGSTLASNYEPVFHFNPSTMDYGTTYYISAIAANEQAMGIPDSNDPCLSLSNPVPVVFVPADLDFNITNDTTICDDASLQLGTGVQNGVSYNWEPAASLSCTDCPNPIASPDHSTNYTVTVTDSEGCADTENVQVFVQCFEIYDTLHIGQVAIQSLNLPPWELVSPGDICDDEDDGHISHGMLFGNTGFFYVGLSEGTDTLCLLLGHPQTIFTSQTFTIYITVIKKPIFSLETPSDEFQFIDAGAGFEENVLNNYQSEEIIIYPNPVKDVLNISSSNSRLKQVELFSLNGKRMLQKDLENHHEGINLGMLDSGMYLLKIETEEGVFLKKIVR